MDGGVCAGPWFSEVHEGGMVVKVEVSCRERGFVVKLQKKKKCRDKHL